MSTAWGIGGIRLGNKVEMIEANWKTPGWKAGTPARAVDIP